MSSLPQFTVNRQSWAYNLGIKAAQAGEPCVPETIFVSRRQQIDFAAGYESVTGPTFATVQFTGSELPKPVETKPVAAKPHNWGDFNAERIIKRNSARIAFREAIYERTARETPHLAGDLLWLPA